MDLAEIVRCPRCKGPLAAPSADSFDCPACALRYPVQDGIPDLLESDALPLPDGTRDEPVAR